MRLWIVLLLTCVGPVGFAATDIQYQSAFLSPIQAQSSQFKALDVNQLIKKAASVPSDPELKIQSVLIVKASFTVEKSIDALKNSALNDIRTLSKVTPELSLWACAQATCQGQIDMALSTVGFVMNYQMLDLREAQNAQWANETLPQDLLTNTQLVTVQEVGQWTHLFTDSFSINIFQAIGPTRTQITNYQLHLVKASAYQKAKYIPFFNLEKNLNSKVRDQLQAIKNYLDKSVSSRAPSSVGNEPNLYRQQSYKLVDPTGDRALLERAAAVPLNILKSVITQEGPQAIDWLPDPYEWEDPLAGKIPEPAITEGLSLQGRDNPLLLESFKKTLTQVIQEESRRGLLPRHGIVHEWSAQYKNRHAFAQTSKLLLTLAMGFTDRFMVTGTEESLRQWILSNSYESVTLPELFRASYRINSGDIYLTLLTIENVLANNWRYNGRENLPITKRLRAISSGYNYKGDRYGTWYHFFGTILYGYAYGSATAKVVGAIEAVGSNIMSIGLDQTQKQWLNVMGGPVGAYLRDVVTNKLYINFVGSKAFLNEHYYLNLREDFRDRLPVETSPEVEANLLGHEHGSMAVFIRIPEITLRSCQVDLIFDTGRGFDSRRKVLRSGVHFTPQRATSLAASMTQAQAVRGFIHHCHGHTGQWIFEAEL
ncbi:MAG: hypothetical protein J7501_08195 [Bdellovibrio sp.]|nr:hypothetical protein [Bdellovibrio sp.]